MRGHGSNSDHLIVSILEINCSLDGWRYESAAARVAYARSKRSSCAFATLSFPTSGWVRGGMAPLIPFAHASEVYDSSPTDRVRVGRYDFAPVNECHGVARWMDHPGFHPWRKNVLGTVNDDTRVAPEIGDVDSEKSHDPMDVHRRPEACAIDLGP